jgi:hypothetical protein
MSEPLDYFPNAFDLSQTKILRAAFDLASATKRGRFIEPARLASALMVIASTGEADPRAMAERPLDRCAKGLF